MARYWCRFFDRDGEVVRAERIVALDVAAVIADARRAAPERAARIEVWRNVNLVHEENLAAAPRSRSKPAAVSSDRAIGATLSGVARLCARA